MDSSKPIVRGGSLRAYVDYLRAVGAFERVMATIARETRPFLVDPPTATEWIDHAHSLNLFSAYEAIAGAAGVRAMTKGSARGGLTEVLLPVVRTALAAFGASPATLFAHAESILLFNVRGQRLHYFSDGSQAGTMKVRLIGRHPPPVYYDAWAGVFDFAIELCGARGEVTVHERGTDGDDGVGSFRVAWR